MDRLYFGRGLRKISSDRLYLYTALNVVCLFCIYVLLFFDLGELRSFFWYYHDNIDDTGMDFYNSMIYVRGRTPYTKFDTLYPPLANLFYWLLYKTVPKSYSSGWPDTFMGALRNRRTKTDLRVVQSTTVLFLVFIVVCVFLIYLLAMYYEPGKKRATILAFDLLTAFGTLYAFERGNIILLAVLLTTFFIFGRKSENKIVRELSYIALALAAGLKLYPAVFGILLIRDKNIKGAVRTVIYGILAFFLPFVFFEGVEGIKIFFSILTKFEKDTLAPFKVSTIISKVPEYLLGKFVDMSAYTAAIESVAGVIDKVFLVLMLLLAFACRKERDCLTVLFIATLFLQGTSSYCLIFSLPCLMVMLEDSDDKYDFSFVFVALLSLPLPLMRYSPRVKLNYITMFQEVIVLGLTLYMIVIAIVDLKARIGQKSRMVKSEV